MLANLWKRIIMIIIYYGRGYQFRKLIGKLVILWDDIHSIYIYINGVLLVLIIGKGT